MKFKAVSFLTFLGIVGFELVALLVGTVTVLAVGVSNISPDPFSSNPSGSHVFFIRIAQYAGIQPDVKLATYYVEPPNGSSIQISAGANVNNSNVCEVSDQTSGYNTNRYLTVTIENPINGNQKVYHISRDRACDLKSGGDGYNSEGENSSNAFYGRYNVPNVGERNGATNLYKLKVTVSLNTSLNQPAVTEGFSQRFVVKITDSSDPNPRVAPLGGSGSNFSIVTDWDKEDYTQYPPRNRTIKIPFGLPCNATANQVEYVGVYDADNGGPTTGFYPLKVSYQVQYFDEDNTVWRDAGLSGADTTGPSIPDGSIDQRPGVGGNVESPNFDTYQVPNGESGDVGLARARVTLRPDVKYRFVVYEIAPRNTVDLVIPEDTIFGDLNCGWKMDVGSDVDRDTITPGQTANFSHWAKNVGQFNSSNVRDTFSWNGPVPSNGRFPTSVPNPYNDTYNDGQRRNFTGGRVVATAADVGRTFCQRQTVNPKNHKVSPGSISSEACTRVVNVTPVPDQVVTLTPSVPDNPNDIEPTETTTLTGSLIVGNFPSITSYGYDEYSKRLDAVQVLATQQDDGIDSQSRTVYTCPAGYSPTNPATNTSTSCSRTVPGTTTYSCPHGVDTQRSSDCRHRDPRNGAANDTRAKCEGNGNTWGGGSCYRDSFHARNSSTGPSTTEYTSPSSSTQYRYRCMDPSAGAWGAWNASPPTGCKKQYQCPGGARVTGTTSTSAWRTSPPTCDGWKCQYSDAIQQNQSTAPTCQYRCQAGTGSAPIIGGTSSPQPCYQRPSFSVTCKWLDNGTTWSDVARANEVVCDQPPSNQIQKLGVSVGSAVCATLTYNPPISAWSPSSPSPGYGSPDGGVTFTQMVNWGWASNASSDTGCTRVVAKPITKVLGGDVAAGSAFVTNGTCASANGSIYAWPRNGRWDAAGTQLAASASGSIIGFSTGMLKDSLKPRRLAFANLPSSSGENIGGSFGSMPCAADHYASRPTGMSAINSLNSINGQQGAFTSTGGQINSNVTINKSQRTSVYATGNVYISSSGIRYQDRGGWVTTQEIPAFKLVVYGGDIYIAPGVTQLDGIYIAQPNGGVGGNIYTCATSTGPYAANQRYNNCNNQSLTVNGAFVAKKVYFHRTKGTQVFGSLPGQTAEQFNYLPELWLANWPQNNQSSEVKYDAITNLPPVL